MSSILKQAGVLTGQKMKAEKDAMAAESAAKLAAQDAARSGSVLVYTNKIAAIESVDIPAYVSNADTKMAAITANVDAQIAAILDDGDADLDDIKGVYDALIAQDAEKDLGIVNYFASSSAALTAHDAAYGDYADFLSGYNA